MCNVAGIFLQGHMAVWSVVVLQSIYMVIVVASDFLCGIFVDAFTS